MKKFLAILLALCMLFALAACGEQAAAPAASSNDSAPAEEAEGPAGDGGDPVPGTLQLL